MNSLPVNLFDLIVIVIVVLSGLVAFARGMAKEVLRLAAWIGAGFAAVYGFAYARPILREVVGIEIVADAIAAIGIFLVALVLFSFIANIIAANVRNSGLSALDRTLGLLFGFVRGGVIVCLLYLFMTWIVKADNVPNWVIEARARPYVERGAQVIAAIAPQGLRNEARAAIEKARKRAHDAVAAQRKANELMTPPKPRAVPVDRKGYTDGERNDMDRLIRSTDGNK